MTESIEELGPVDYLVVEFPGSNFNGEILPELADLVRVASSGCSICC